MQQHAEQSTGRANPAPALAVAGPADRSKRELWLVLAALTILYAIMAGLDSRRFVWYDELFTFDIAKAPTIGLMLRYVRDWDFNPPTLYLLTRLSMSIFGFNAVGLRMPSIIEFYAASMMLFIVTRRKVGTYYAVVALLILWWGNAFFYATEARPYALTILYFATLLFCWDELSRGTRQPLILAGVAASSLGLVFAHVFAPLILLPFLVAEAVRYARTRAFDLPLWCALTLPMLAVVSYLPSLRIYREIMFAPEVRASWHRVLRFFSDSLVSIAVVVALAVLAALLTAAVVPARKLQDLVIEDLRPEEIIVFLVLLANPIILNLVLMHGQRAFWDRYTITTAIAMDVGIAILMGRSLRCNRAAASAACIVLLMFTVRYKVLAPIVRQPPNNLIDLASVDPNLPMVIDSGVTFIEMNHYESPSVLARLYFLTDRSSAIRYAHATGFDFSYKPDELRNVFPVSANVSAYGTFVRNHNRFQVFSTHDNPEGWVLAKLRDDHAQIVSLGEYAAPGSYRASTLYVVTMPPG